MDSTNIVLSNNEYYFAALSHVNLPSTLVYVNNYQQISPNTIKFDVTATQVAPFLWMESSYMGRYSDNGFLLPGMQTRTIYFYADEKLNVNDFGLTLTTRSVMDTIEQVDSSKYR